jgi:hypothetical protein
MKPSYDNYVWLDGSMTLTRPDSLEWLLDQLGTNDIALFKHPDRSTARQETDYIELKKDHPYITTRYKNGLHKEQMAVIENEGVYEDDVLYASTVFVYRNTRQVQDMLKEWLYTSVRYFTCDQVALPYLCWQFGLNVKVIDLNPFKNPYLAVGSKHK